MYDVYGKAYLSENIFKNGLNMGLPQQAKVETMVHRVETLTLQ